MQMMNSPIIEFDVHGMRTRGGSCGYPETSGSGQFCGVFKIRVIHGYNGGTRIRSAIREEFSYGGSRR